MSKPPIYIKWTHQYNRHIGGISLDLLIGKCGVGYGHNVSSH